MGQAVPKLETTVKLYREPGGPSDLLGFADVVIASSFVIKGLRIIMGKPKDDKPGGPFISFPAKKGNGAAADKWFEIAHPITAEARKAVQECVLSAYAKAAASQGARA
jgi:stage V sporulation protein G